MKIHRNTKILCMILLVTISTMLLNSCCFNHEWIEATCTEPRTCAKCGKTDGVTLEHDWIDATCTEPKTCAVCSTTDGEPLEHDWIDATCVSPKTCRACKATEGKALGHDFSNYNNFVCTRCHGEKTFTASDFDEMIREAEVDYTTFKNSRQSPFTMSLIRRFNRNMANLL